MTAYGEQLATLFRTCSVLRHRFNQIEKEAEKVQEISMNASVVAGQTGSHMRVFNEIANQIALTARRSKIRTAAMRDEVNQIVGLNLSILVCERRITKYEQTLTHLVGKKNRDLVLKTMYQHQEQVTAQIQLIYRHIHPTQSLLKTIMQYQYRTFAALNALKVEATNLHGSEFSAILALGETLSAIAEAGAMEIAEVLKMLRNIKSGAASVTRLANKEMIYAEIHTT